MKSNRTRKIAPYLFVLPWFLGVLMFTAGPLIMSLVMSFFDWPVIGEAKFIGLRNYIELFRWDTQFYDSLAITFKFSAIFVPLTIVLSLVLALIITKPVKGMNILRIIFYLPTVVSSVAVSIIWGWILNSDYGVLNYFLSLFGVNGPDWLNSKIWAIVALVIASGWTVGTMMLVFYTALKGISLDIYEAAKIDGASETRTFFNITLPLITPTLLFNIVTSFISSLQNLALVMLLTKGGPMKSTYMYGLFVYDNAFGKSRLGYAAASAWVMFFIIMILTSLIFKSSDTWVYNKEVSTKGKKVK
ncbi:MAG TPA: sugar ABC transporter permease [Lachnospiraceae bacterium]|nr:sugar ABC transporter permease [Lachnospiraceae bacterium]